jgi:hypothetical protein
MKTARNTIAKKIDCEESNSKRMEIAKYGETVPGVFRVEYWQNRWKICFTKWQEAGSKGSPGLDLSEPEREALLGLFMWPFVKLDDKFFNQAAEAIRRYKSQTMPVDPLRQKLNNSKIWFAVPPLTRKDLAALVGYTGDMSYFSRLLKRMNIPHRPDRRGRPRKIQTN